MDGESKLERQWRERRKGGMRVKGKERGERRMRTNKKWGMESKGNIKRE